MTSLGADAELTMDTVVAAVSEGKCVLFLGSAIHAPPPKGSKWEETYPEAERPELAGALTERLKKASKFPGKLQVDKDEADTWELQRVAMFAEAQLRRHGLVEQIRAAVRTGKKPSPIVRGLAELDFPVIVTTNYDKLFEDALSRAGKDPHVDIYDPDPDESPEDAAEPSVREPFVFKMHGDLDRPDSIVITDEDYIQFVLLASALKDGPMPRTYAYHMTKRPTLFLGYSLHDYNLRLLFKMLRWKVDVAKIPGAYSVDIKPDPLILHVWQRELVTFIAQDVWTFVPELYRRVTGRKMPA